MCGSTTGSPCGTLWPTHAVLSLTTELRSAEIHNEIVEFAVPKRNASGRSKRLKRRRLAEHHSTHLAQTLQIVYLVPFDGTESV